MHNQIAMQWQMRNASFSYLMKWHRLDLHASCFLVSQRLWSLVHFLANLR